MDPVAHQPNPRRERRPRRADEEALDAARSRDGAGVEQRRDRRQPTLGRPPLEQLGARGVDSEHEDALPGSTSGTGLRPHQARGGGKPPPAAGVGHGAAPPPPGPGRVRARRARWRRPSRPARGDIRSSGARRSAARAPGSAGAPPPVRARRPAASTRTPACPRCRRPWARRGTPATRRARTAPRGRCTRGSAGSRRRRSRRSRPSGKATSPGAASCASGAPGAGPSSPACRPDAAGRAGSGRCRSSRWRRSRDAPRVLGCARRARLAGARRRRRLGEPRRSHEPPPCEQCCRQIGPLEHECLHPRVRVEVGGERRVDGRAVEHDQRCRPHALLCENALQGAAQQGRPLERSQRRHDDCDLGQAHRARHTRWSSTGDTWATARFSRPTSVWSDRAGGSGARLRTRGRLGGRARAGERWGRLGALCPAAQRGRDGR